MQEKVILVNMQDEVQGYMDKMEAHEKGLLHRAFSVFLFNEKGEMLLQQRAMSKYHSGGLWSNTCCSHPRKDETVEKAAHRRLMEEMGLKADLEHKFHFIYKSNLDKGLIEHELDYVLFGGITATPKPNPKEVHAWKFMHPDDIQADMSAHPDRYTSWFRICFDQVIARL